MYPFWIYFFYRNDLSLISLKIICNTTYVANVLVVCNIAASILQGARAMDIKKLFGILLLMFFCSAVIANDKLECLQLDPATVVEFNINSPNFYNCISIARENQTTPIAIATFSNDRTSFLTSVYDSNKNLMHQHSHSMESPLSIIPNIGLGNTVYLKIDPKTKLNENKNVEIFFNRDAGIDVLTIKILSIKKTSTRPPISPPHGCNPDTGICYDPLSLPITTFQSDSYNTSSVSNAVCSIDTAPPEGIDSRYDIQEFKIYLEEIANTLESSTLTFPVKEVLRANVFVSFVRPKGALDFKSPEAYFSGSEKFGNYNYGYLGRAIGYETETLLRAGAAMQAYQNVSKYPQLYKLELARLVIALTAKVPGTGDNPGDSEQIQRGADAYDSGCDPTQFTHTQPISGGSGGANSGWNGFRVFLGLSGCIGKCYGKVTITDLPPTETP